MISLLFALIILSGCKQTVQAQLPEDFVKGFSGNNYKIETIHRFIQSINLKDSITYRSYLSTKVKATEVPKAKIVSANFQMMGYGDITDTALLELTTDTQQALLYRLDEVVIEYEPAPILVFTPVELRKPEYMDENQYVGNERDVVRILNMFMKYTNLRDVESRLNLLSDNNSLNQDYLYPIILGMKIRSFEFKDNDQTAIVYTTMEYEGGSDWNPMFVLLKENEEWRIGMID